MKLSLNWIKQYTKVELPVDELVKKIGAQLGEVEGVEDLAPKYEGAAIVKIVTCEDHPNADRLHVVTVDDGGVTAEVTRNDDGTVQIVCGAPNVKAGILAVWLPPGATVPESYGKDPFVLEARELRGVVSNGMLASPKELALGDSHDGILQINADEWSPNQQDIKPGASFGKVFGLDDAVIDIENKMFTHRPDLFGELGLAREVAGITGNKFTSPDWYKAKPEFPTGDGLPLTVSNESPELVPRLMTLVISDVQVKPSPLWLQCALVSVGGKPINNIVDVTNYIMLLTAQPTHAYDYDKLRGQQLTARSARPDEQATLLNGKTYTLDAKDIVIADGDGPIGLGGVMGGGNSEVSEDTKNIVLECATFDMYAVRRSSMRHGLFTDALTRFTKGQSPLQNPHVLHLLMEAVQDVAGGTAASAVADEGYDAARQWVHPPVPVTAEFINARLGLKLPADEMKQLLENVEFSIEQEGDKLMITAPFWRTDIETREDVVEEIGRLYGYDKLPLQLPQRSVKPVDKDDLLELKNRLRENLVKCGANEVLTYSFVHGDLLQKAGQDASLAYKVGNALSPDLQYYRLSLTPSLLDKVHMNIKAGYDEFALFELGNVHAVSEVDEAGLPKQFGRLSFVLAKGGKASNGAAYYGARRYLDALLQGMRFAYEVSYVALADYDFGDHTLFMQLATTFEPNRSAVVTYDGGKPLGIIGEYRPRRALKLPPYTAGFELFLSPFKHTDLSSYVQLSRFPKVQQDITLKVPANVPNGQIHELFQSAVAEYKKQDYFASAQQTSIFSSEADYRNVSYSLQIASYEKTMTDAEVSRMLARIADQAHEQFGAERV